MPEHENTAPAADTDSFRVTRLLRDVRSGQTDTAQLSPEDRRALVEYLWTEGLSNHEMASLLNVCDRTIKRDRQAIRHVNAIEPSRELSQQLAGELLRRAEIAIDRLSRAVRDDGAAAPPTPNMRMRSAIQSFRIYERLTDRLHQFGYLDRYASGAMSDRAVDNVLKDVATRWGMS